MVKDHPDLAKEILTNYYPGILFNVGIGETEDYNNPGIGILGNGSCTAGYPARNSSNTRNYLVTAGHCTGNTFTTVNGTIIGTRSGIEQNRGSVDALGINGEYWRLSSRVQGTSTDLNSYEAIPNELIGQTTRMSGGESGLTSGTFYCS